MLGLSQQPGLLADIHWFGDVDKLPQVTRLRLHPLLSPAISAMKGHYMAPVGLLGAQTATVQHNSCGTVTFIVMLIGLLSQSAA